MNRPAAPGSERSASSPAPDRGARAEPLAGEYVLVVDDDDAVRHLLRSQLDYLGHPTRTAHSAEEALDILGQHPSAALVITDVQMPGLSGVDLLARLQLQHPNLQVVMLSGHQDLETVRGALRKGAYDYLVKPYELPDLSITVERAIDRGRLLRQNEQYRQNLERMVLEQTTELRQTRDIALMTLAKLAESRDSETGNHLERMAAYSRRLAEELQHTAYGRSISHGFVEHLFKSSPLHDIGKVGIDDAILRKPGPLTANEFAVMQTHTTIGGVTLQRVIERYESHSFLHMGMAIAFSHHERWDGSGYPQRLVGDAIPLEARIVALADAYDAITSDRPYKRAFNHAEARSRIREARASHFDPVIADAFERCHADFEEIRRRFLNGDEGGLVRPLRDL